MKHSTGKPTKAEAARMARLKEMPCVACAMGLYPPPQIESVEVHHLLSGNKRRGHMFTIPLCTYHHRAVRIERGVPVMDFCATYGPNLARSSRDFRAMYGTDNELLARTNELLKEGHS